MARVRDETVYNIIKDIRRSLTEIELADNQDYKEEVLYHLSDAIVSVNLGKEVACADNQENHTT